MPINQDTITIWRGLQLQRSRLGDVVVPDNIIVGDDLKPARQVLGNETLTDISGAIAIGGTAQSLVIAAAGRIGLVVQNLSNGDLWLSPHGTALADKPSIRIPPAYGVYETPRGFRPVGAWSIIGATTGQKFTAWWW